jgi:hypothetical protein
VIGLFGFIGLSGALVGQCAGRLVGRSVTEIIVAVVLLDIAVQGVNILDRTRLFAVASHARSRLDTAFVTCSFIGGAMVSAAFVPWSADGRTVVSLTGPGLGCAALLAWALGRRGPLLNERSD